MEMFLLCSDDSESDVRMVADECLNKIIKVRKKQLSLFFPTHTLLLKHCLQLVLAINCHFQKHLYQPVKLKWFFFKTRTHTHNTQGHLIKNICPFCTVILLSFVEHVLCLTVLKMQLKENPECAWCSLNSSSICNYTLYLSFYTIQPHLLHNLLTFPI